MYGAFYIDSTDSDQMSQSNLRKNSLEESERQMNDGFYLFTGINLGGNKATRTILHIIQLPYCEKMSSS